jgi:uncharacterized membrane protein
MFTQPVFWPWFAGLVFIAGGLVAFRKEFLAARGLDKLIVLGPVFVAAPLAVFSADHFTAPHDIMQMVPDYMPARLFWAYFVGCALLATATSLIAMKCVRLSTTLLGVMFFLFVLMMDLPAAIADPRTRLTWNLVLRESAYGGGAWAMAGSLGRESQTGKPNWMVLIGRVTLAIASIFYGVQQILHPELAPGVPDVDLTPTWAPLHALWGYPVGALLLIAGVALLLNKYSRTAAASIGGVMTLLTVVLYVPLLALTRDPSQMNRAINVVYDTLFFGGMALFVARACRADTPVRRF